MGRGTAIYEALVKGSNGKLEPIKATEVTKEMKDRSEIFYCPTSNCKAKLSHNRGRGKNPKPYFFLRKLPKGELNNHVDCDYINEYVNIKTANKKRIKYHGVEWRVPLFELEGPNNVDGLSPHTDQKKSSIKITRTNKFTIKPNIEKLASVRSLFALRNELKEFDKETQVKTYSELKDQCVFYNTKSYDKLLIDIQNKKVDNAFYVLGYLWMSEWKSLKFSENPYFFLRGANRDIIKCYTGINTVGRAVKDLTWEIRNKLENNPSAKKSVFIAAKGVKVGTETLKINEKSTTVSVIKVYEVGTEED